MKNRRIAYTNENAPGAIPRGTPIVKVATDAGDINPIGTRGTVLGSLRHGDQIGYFVEWEVTPGLPVFVLDFKIGRQRGIQQGEE
jgi:hypothetical protein